MSESTRKVVEPTTLLPCPFCGACGLKVVSELRGDLDEFEEG